MKKLMFAMAAVAAGVVFAEDAITSANIVGYATKETPQAKFQIGSVPFETCDGTLDFTKILTGFTPVEIDWEGDPTAFKPMAAQLQIWDLDLNNYVMAYYVSNGWYDNGTEEGDVKEGWCNADGLLFEGDYRYEIVPGGAYWVKNVPDSKSLNVAGSVGDDDVVSYPCTANFALAGNAFPVEIEMNGTQMTSDDIVPVDIDWEGDPTAFKNGATQLQIWDKELNNYVMAYYVSNGWYDNGTEEGDVKAGWCNADGLLFDGDYSYTIPAAGGFWVRAVSGKCTLDFHNPVAK